jgi:hypothetical protein
MRLRRLIFAPSARQLSSSSEKPIQLFKLKDGTIAVAIPQRVADCSSAPETH